MENIDNDYIKKAVGELIDLLGIKENIDYDLLFDSLDKRDITVCIQKIATYLGLPVKIILSYIFENDGNSSWSGSIPMGSGQEERFESSELVRTDGKNSGVQGIAAQVLIPPDLPFYGSSRLDGFPIKVRVSRNCSDYPEAFIYTIAHELSHILLTTLGSDKAKNEIYTDLTPMILGFSDIAHDGRRTVKVTKERGILSTTTTTRTISYGYLNDSQFDCAYSEINRILSKNALLKVKLLKEIKHFEKMHKVCLDYIKLFKKVLSKLESNGSFKFKDIKNKQGISWSSLSSFDEINILIQKDFERIEKLKKYYKSFAHYTKHNVDILTKNTENTQKFSAELKKEILEMKKSLGNVINYLDFGSKIRAKGSYINLKLKSASF